MNMLIKRRQLIVATLVVALGSAVFINWYFTNSDEKTVNTSETKEFVQNIGEAKYVNSDKTEEANDKEVISSNVKTEDYFSKAKLERTKANDKALEDLKKLINSGDSNEKVIKEISKKADALSKAIKLESDIEALISTKLKCECLVVLTEKSAEIVVEKGNLSDDGILQITDAVLSNTELSASDIKISEG